MNRFKCLILLVFAIFHSMAFAGLATPTPVQVDLVEMSALGDQWTARTDPDPQVFIGCGVRMVDDGAGGVFGIGFCQARDNEGDTTVCSTENPGLLQAIDGISDFSFIVFAWNADLTCTRIGHSTQSQYLPEFKIK